MLAQPYDVEVGAGTMSPDTFLRVLGPDPIAIAYTQPSRRPADGRYGENPNRLYKHTQLQVILKPPPADIQEIYLESLEAIGIRLREHDIKFEEDNWEWPVGGAWGVGWQVMLDGLEITQFTYFQQCGGMDLDPISGEITYGLERIAAFLQDVDSLYDVVWAVESEDGTRGDLRRDSPARRSCSFRFTTSRRRTLASCGSICGCTRRSARRCWTSFTRPSGWRKRRSGTRRFTTGWCTTERPLRRMRMCAWRCGGFRCWARMSCA